MKRFVLTFILVAAGAAGPSAARAQERAPSSGPSATSGESAAVHFRRAVELYDEADFGTALVEFKRAYETQPDFRVLYNIAQTEYQLTRYAEALGHFAAYLEQGQAAISPARRAEVEREIKKLGTRVATLQLVVDPPGADVYVDQDLVGTSPIAKPILVSAGRHVVRVSKPLHVPFARAIELAGADAIDLSVSLEPLARTPVADPTATRTAREAPSTAKGTSTSEQGPGSTLPLALFIGGGAFALGAVTTGVLALGASNDLRERRDAGPMSADELADAQRKVTPLAVATDVLAASAIVAGGLGLYFSLKSPSREQAQSTRRDSGVRVVPSVLGGAVQGAF